MFETQNKTFSFKDVVSHGYDNALKHELVFLRTRGMVKLPLSMLIFFGNYRASPECKDLWPFFPSVKPKVRACKVDVKMHEFLRCASNGTTVQCSGRSLTFAVTMWVVPKWFALSTLGASGRGGGLERPRAGIPN